MKRAYIFYVLALLLLAAACANPGSGPDGGPYDETPPRIVGMNPPLGRTGTQTNRVTITFDELITVENPGEKVTISPPQINIPDIRTSGRRITVELLDTLHENTTYTIDFSDAIQDSNEGNPLGNFTYLFSTGSTLDTMEVAGHVLAAENLEPVKGILVGLHRDTCDTAFTRRPFDRVARTDSRGRFSVKGVAPGTYRIYALKDMDGDYKFSMKGEMIAFMPGTVTPSSFPDVRYDTLWRDTVRYDTIMTVHYTHYVPDNLVLLAFTEADQPRHLLKTQRDVPEWFRLYFTAPSRRRPVLRGLNFDAENAFVESRSEGYDTITYWLRDTALVRLDTLSFTCTYEATDDSTGLSCEQTDTFDLVPRLTVARRAKQQAERMEKWEKQRERRHKRGDFSEEEPPRDYLKFENRVPAALPPDRNVSFSVSEPLARFDTAGLHLLLGPDSACTEAPYVLRSDTLDPLRFTLYGEWRPGQQYTLRIDSAAVRGVYGHWNKREEWKFQIPALETFGTLFLTLPGADTTATVQLLRSDTQVYRQQRARDGRADFYYLQPGNYYLRLFYDHNGNGRWDPGEFAAGRQAEEVYYFPVALQVRANWDIEQTWNVRERSILRQKPEELIKQKADGAKQTARERNEQRMRDKQ